jgi:hypothetical protein
MRPQAKHISQSEDELATGAGEFQREAAVDCLNKALNLLDRKGRSQEDDM